jgi:hypothetical protein
VTDTNQASPAAAPAEQANGSGVYQSSLEERSAALFGTATSEPVVDPSGAAPPVEPAASAADSGDADAQRQARREALAKLADRERSSVDAMAHKRQNEELSQRLAAAEKRAEEAERMAGQRIDMQGLTEDQFFEHARNAKVTPQRLGEWLREQMANPELAAARAATSAVDPKISALEKRIAEQQEQIQSFLQGQQSAHAQAEEERAIHEFTSYAVNNATTSPRTAAFLREFGHEDFVKLATSAAAMVPPNAGPQAVLDEIEDNLARLARIYAGSPAAANPSTPKPNHGAAKPMTTVSNTLAQTRASVVDEDADWATLPFEERSARLFR